MKYNVFLVLLLLNLSLNTPINNINRKRAIQSKDKFCLITLHDQSSTYDKNFIDAFNEIGNELGVEVEIKSNIPEGEECYTTAKQFMKNIF